MYALSFTGPGISSSELSWSAAYCCDCDLGSLAADVADPGTGLDSLLLTCCLEDGRRSACLADVLRPIDVKWLPGPIGVGDVVAISAVLAVVVVLDVLLF